MTATVSVTEIGTKSRSRGNPRLRSAFINLLKNSKLMGVAPALANGSDDPPANRRSLPRTAFLVSLDGSVTIGASLRCLGVSDGWAGRQPTRNRVDSWFAAVISVSRGLPWRVVRLVRTASLGVEKVCQVDDF